MYYLLLQTFEFSLYNKIDPLFMTIMLSLAISKLSDYYQYALLKHTHKIHKHCFFLAKKNARRFSYYSLQTLIILSICPMCFEGHYIWSIPTPSMEPHEHVFAKNNCNIFHF